MASWPREVRCVNKPPPPRSFNSSGVLKVLEERILTDPFNFELLPQELQDRILMEVAVERRVAGGTSEEVKEALGLVCPLWRETVHSKLFSDQVEERAILREPFCRYLEYAVPVTVWFFDQKRIDYAVTLGDQLYVMEITTDYKDDLFVYDIDDTRLRHADVSKRNLEFHNCRPFTVNGVNHKKKLILPCPSTKTLYVVSKDVDRGSDNNAVVRRVAPSGEVLMEWTLDEDASQFFSITINPSGSHLVLTSEIDIHIYATSTGRLVVRKEDPTREFFTDEEVLKDDGSYLGCAIALMLNDRPESLVVFNQSIEEGYGEETVVDNRTVLALGDEEVAVVHHPCLLLMYAQGHKVFNRLTGCERDVKLNAAELERILKHTCQMSLWQVWFDKERGLVFRSGHGKCLVHRITN